MNHAPCFNTSLTVFNSSVWVILVATSPSLFDIWLRASEAIPTDALSALGLFDFLQCAIRYLLLGRVTVPVVHHVSSAPLLPRRVRFSSIPPLLIHHVHRTKRWTVPNRFKSSVCFLHPFHSLLRLFSLLQSRSVLSILFIDSFIFLFDDSKMWMKGTRKNERKTNAWWFAVSLSLSLLCPFLCIYIILWLKRVDDPYLGILRPIASSWCLLTSLYDACLQLKSIEWNWSWKSHDQTSR